MYRRNRLSFHILPLAIALLTAFWPAAKAQAQSLPKPDHTVIVIEENHSYESIIGSSSAPYINRLAKQGALFTNSFAIEHPSQPNYLDLFSGGNQGVTDDTCLSLLIHNDNLGAELLSTKESFVGYSEDLYAVGDMECAYGEYQRKHNPWSDFANIPSAANRPYTNFPAKYGALPTVAFVVPNQLNDMHDGTVADGDTWLKENLDGYAQWAQTHNSLLIVTWDEDDYSGNNHIATMFVGAMVKPGQYREQINHYRVLRTIEDLYHLKHAGNAAKTTPITDVWKPAGVADFGLETSSPIRVAQGGAGSGAITVAPQSGFTGKVTLTISGLPTGVKAVFSPSSTAQESVLTLTAGVAAPLGTYHLTVTGTSGKLAHSTALSLTLLAKATDIQLLGNPGFENGDIYSAPWMATSGVINAEMLEPNHSGAWNAWLCGYGEAHVDNLAQQVTLPKAKRSATLSYWLHIDTAETDGTAHDTLKVELRTTRGAVLKTLASYSNLDAHAGYLLKTVDLSAYLGQTVVIYLVGTEDSAAQTSFVLDDFALTLK